jgi:hypothetical protein
MVHREAPTVITPQHHGALPGRRTVLRGALLTATAALSATCLDERDYADTEVDTWLRRIGLPTR